MRVEATAVLACAWLVGARAGSDGAAGGAAVSDLPAALAVSPAEQFAFSLTARGDQVYRCRRSASDPAGFAWAFEAPAAELFGDDGERVGRHFAGPTWEATDGSRIAGEVRARVDSPVAGAIPWLLVVVTRREGAGRFATVTSLQRVDTAGGVAPSSGCDAGLEGAELRVPYRATYRFFVAAR
jgi:hypothetical protein